jgi:hypothetical protein
VRRKVAAWLVQSDAASPASSPVDESSPVLVSAAPVSAALVSGDSAASGLVDVSGDVDEASMGVTGPASGSGVGVPAGDDCPGEQHVPPEPAHG